MKSISDIQKSIIILVIVILGFLLHYKYTNEFPSHIHAWAQADHYALALGFVNNDLNFLKPETFVYNHQFPFGWEIPFSETITAVDFPIHNYIPALFMKITGNTSPWIYRIYILLYSFIGLFFLFKLSILINGNFYKSIFIVIFVSTSPVFVYYQNGFLPTIPSLANAFIGIYFYFKYLNSKKNRYFSLAIFFLTFATLSRTTFVIPLIAVLSFEFLRLLHSRNFNIRTKILPLFLSAASILFYILYNNYLRNEYGSIFLNKLMPASDFNHVLDILLTVKEKWLTHYFTYLHYTIIIALIISIIIVVARKKIIKNKLSLNLLFIVFIIFIGDFLFFIAMTKQFSNHDYYFLDTFFITIILLIVGVLSLLPKIDTKYKNIICSSIIVIIALPLAYKAYKSQEQIRVTGNWDKIQITINNFNGSEAFLSSLGIADTSKILVIDPYAPNIPFILMNRKGYVVMRTTQEIIKEALNWNFDFLVIQNDFFVSDIYSVYPEILSKIEKIGDNGNLYVCKLSKDTLEQSLDDFIGLSMLEPVFTEKITYDTPINKYWSNTFDTVGFSFSGNKCGILQKNNIYGLTYKSKNIKALTQKKRQIVLSSNIYQDTIQDCSIVISIKQDGEDLFYKTYNLKKLCKNRNVWEKVNITETLPMITSENYEFAIYIWNTNESKLFIDDFEFSLY